MNDASGRTGRSMSIDRWLQVRPGNEMAVALGGGVGQGFTTLSVYLSSFPRKR